MTGTTGNLSNKKYNLRRIRKAIARRFLERIKGPGAAFENAVQVASRRSQLSVLFANVTPGSFQGKTVLEVGCGHGHLGAELEKLGARVISTDARPENVRQAKRKFPGREAFVLDVCSSDDMANQEPVDITLAFGLLCHLPCPSQFLSPCSKLSDRLLLESAAMYVLEPEIWFRKETRFLAFYDQTVHGGGCRPSPAWVNRELASLGYHDIADLCSDESKWEEIAAPTYSWKLAGSGIGKRFGDAGYRRMWAATKGEFTREGNKIIL